MNNVPLPNKQMPTLRPNPFRNLGFLAYFTVLLIMSAWLVSIGQAFIGSLGIAFGALGTAVFFLLLMPNGSYLRVDNNGFETCSLFRKSWLRWLDVERFWVYNTAGVSKRVVFTFSERYRKAVSRTNAVVTDHEWDGFLPDTYGMSAEALAAFMNYYIEKSEKPSSEPMCNDSNIP